MLHFVLASSDEVRTLQDPVKEELGIKASVLDIPGLLFVWENYYKPLVQELLGLNIERTQLGRLAVYRAGSLLHRQ